MITLYQFKCSHFCEKASWALDYKGVAYECRNLVPGRHIKPARAVAPKSGLPIIVDDGVVVQDSTDILTFLDRKYPEPPLTPRDPLEAKEALEWEEYLDLEVGVTVRLWFYFHTLPDRERALRFLTQGATWFDRLLFPFLFPKVRVRMTEFMNIDAESARRAEERLLAAMGRLDAALSQRPFLVGDAFSRADLTACALLAPLCLEGRSDAEVVAALPPQVRALREAHRRRRCFEWAMETYRTYRQPQARMRSAAAAAAGDLGRAAL